MAYKLLENTLKWNNKTLEDVDCLTFKILGPNHGLDAKNACYRFKKNKLLAIGRYIIEFGVFIDPDWRIRLDS